MMRCELRTCWVLEGNLTILTMQSIQFYMAKTIMFPSWNLRLFSLSFIITEEIKENNFGVGRVEPSDPNTTEAS